MKKYLTVKEKLAYGFGDNGLSMAYTVISFFFLFYLTDVIGLNPALAGTVVLVGKLWDAVTDPWCGYLSDRTRSKWGRRRPFFLYSALPFGLTFFLLFSGLKVTGQFQLFLLYSALYLLFTTAYTAYAVPYMSLTPELTPNYDERTNLTAYRMAFSIVGGLVAVVLPEMIVDAFGDIRLGYGVMGAVFGIIVALSPLAVFFGTRERVSDSSGQVPFLQGVKQILKNKPFLIALVIFLFTWGAMDIISAIFIYFIKYWLQIEGKDSIIFAILFLTATVLLPFWVWVSGKYGKRFAYVTGIGSLILVLFSIILLKPGQLYGIYFLAFLAGAGVSVVHVIPYAILPDCIDFGQLETGQRVEGVYYGFTTFSRKVATSFSIFTIGQVLNWTGYVADQAQNTATLWAFRILLGPAAAVLLVVGIYAMMKFPIDRERHAAIISEINTQHGKTM